MYLATCFFVAFVYQKKAVFRFCFFDAATGKHQQQVASLFLMRVVWPLTAERTCICATTVLERNEHFTSGIAHGLLHELWLRDRRLRLATAPGLEYYRRGTTVFGVIVPSLNTLRNVLGMCDVGTAA